MRYVVLHHTGWQADHFDLLLEISDAAPLASWRLTEWPPISADVVVPNGQHRRAYLDYEGPIGGGRGVVRRVAAGTYATVRSSENSLIIKPYGPLPEISLPLMPHVDR